MIPKVIHYCWFGEKQKNELVCKCLASWKKFCPDYEIVEWNETNFPTDCTPYIQQAYQHKKYAHVTDYARLKIIYENGGIYLDTDVELIASPDPFLADRAFFAMQKAGEVATGLGFGAEAGTPILKELMKNYEEKIYDGKDRFWTETCVNTDQTVFVRHGLTMKNETQRLDEVGIYPSTYFNPKNFETGKIEIAKETVSIHHYYRSWHDACERMICDQYAALLNRYEEEEAKKQFRRWYRRNRLRLLLKRYGYIGAMKKVKQKLFG